MTFADAAIFAQLHELIAMGAKTGRRDIAVRASGWVARECEQGPADLALSRNQLEIHA